LNTGKRLSMSHNWEFALSHVSDGWVALIGDDDGLMPNALQRAAEIIKETGTRAIRSSLCIYSWPSLTGMDWGRMSVPLGSSYEARGSQQWLSTVMTGRAYYLELPVLYTGGFVDNAVLREIKARSGSIYRSSIPDVYSGLAIARVCKDYVYSFEPLAINGGSKHSTGTSVFGGGKSVSGGPASKFASEGNIPFHPDLCPNHDGTHPPSIHSLVYESFLQSEHLEDIPVLGATHSNQLELILATGGHNGSIIEDWGRKFAQAHGLDYADVYARSLRKRRALSLALLPQKLRRALNTIAVGSARCPIRDVAEATAVAVAVRSEPPGLISRLGYLADRARDVVLKR